MTKEYVDMLVHIWIGFVCGVLVESAWHLL